MVCSLFNEEKKAWEYQEDNIGKTIYSKNDKSKLKVDYLGLLKEEHTLLVPKEFDKWDEETKSWIENSVEKEKNRIVNIKEEAGKIILERYPLFKQTNAQLLIYGQEYLDDMIAFITDIKSQSDDLELDATKTKDDFVI